jgi:methyl-accepting chemotaxis protein
MQRIFSRLSLTGKLASIVVAINVFSLAAFAFHGWSNETISAVTQASVNWSHTAEQFAEVSAGGVKWGKADVIRDGYKLYRDDPALNLVQFSALNLSGQPVDSWTRDGTSGLPAGEQLAALVKASAGKTMLDMTNASSGFVTVVAPLPKSKSGADVGFVITSWSTTTIYDAALKSALATLAFEGVFVVISVVALLFALRRMVTVPLNTIGESIKVLQQGDYRTPVPFTAKQDLIGTVARALDTFRKQMIVAGETDENARAQQRLLDEERAASARAMADSAQEQYAVMSKLAHALEELAAGDFSGRLGDLGADFAKVSGDFNRMVVSVAATLQDISETASQVEAGSSNLASSADQLSKRTEQQAASLEETAAALDEITSTVQTSSQKASEAGEQVMEAKTSAHMSATIVKQAIGAMDRIQDSSSRIGQIIGVVDEIAFQTNLLALNAGVEAARAGDAGKGFAVVAQEVRALAQRSAAAAKEIKDLVSISGKEVESGVRLVNETGDSLLKIENQINDISDTIQMMVQSYREQSSGLREINTAINHMDQTTQQNAAMVEETNAACMELLSLSTTLKEAVGRFTLSTGTGRPVHAAMRVAS